MTEYFVRNCTIHSSHPERRWAEREAADLAMLQAHFDSEAAKGFPVSAENQRKMRALMEMQGFIGTEEHVAQKPKKAEPPPVVIQPMNVAPSATGPLQPNVKKTRSA